MSEFSIKLMEKLGNSYLRLDPETIARLRAHQDKIAKINLTDLSLSFYMQPSAQGFILSKSSTAIPNTIIESSCFDLLKMVCTQDKQPNLVSKQLKLSGDLDFGQALYKILREIDIDWEEHLAKLLGDTLAYQCMKQARGTLNYLKRGLGLLRDNTQEYLQEEARYTPSPIEVEDFYEAIAVLKNDVERAEIKLELLKNKKSTG